MLKDTTLLEEISDQELNGVNGGTFVPGPPPTVTDRITGIEFCGLINKMPPSKAQEIITQFFLITPMYIWTSFFSVVLMEKVENLETIYVSVVKLVLYALMLMVISGYVYLDSTEGNKSYAE